MRFEFSIASRYLLPRKRQLSVSLIALLSILVITLVIWLILVFFSVTNGLEKRWTETLIAINAPVQVTPSEDYYNSYYYLIDTISEDSDFSQKTIAEKLNSEKTDPHNKEVDIQIPFYWPQPEKKDLVKELFDSVEDVGAHATDYETALSNLKLNLIRQSARHILTQASIVTSFNGKNKYLAKTIVEPSAEDIQNLLFATDQAAGTFEEKTKNLLANAKITHLLAPEKGFLLKKDFLPKSGKLKVIATFDGGNVQKVVITKKASKGNATLDFSNLTIGSKKVKGPIFVEGATLLPVTIKHSPNVAAARDLKFTLNLKLQNLSFRGEIKYNYLDIGRVEAKTVFASTPKIEPPWLYYIGNQSFLPKYLGDEVAIAPKSFRDSGALIGDKGHISYHSTTTTSVQEQRIPIRVVGFYDPGIVPIGNKLIMTTKETTSLLLSSLEQRENWLSLGNGMHVWFDNFNNAKAIKEKLQQSLENKGIAKYWKVESFYDYEFSRGFLQQLASDKMLFLLIAIIIIIVACSNIATMLILLVNDKKKEIGILQSMGASTKSIIIIFGSCGAFIGLIANGLGILLAMLTLKYLPFLIDILSAIQGRNAFDPSIFGKSLPNELSMQALVFVAVASILIATTAALIPAIKASLMRPAKVLRSQ